MHLFLCNARVLKPENTPALMTLSNTADAYEDQHSCSNNILCQFCSSAKEIHLSLQLPIRLSYSQNTISLELQSNKERLFFLHLEPEKIKHRQAYHKQTVSLLIKDQEQLLCLNKSLKWCLLDELQSCVTGVLQLSGTEEKYSSFVRFPWKGICALQRLQMFGIQH